MLALKLPRRPLYRLPRGFTLVELLVVLALIGVMATLMVPGFRDVAANNTLSGVASDFMTTSLNARSMALKTNRRAIIAPLSGTDWRNGWRAYVDMNQNGSYDSGTDTLIAEREALPSDITLISLTGSSTESGNSISIVGFSGTGFLATIGSSSDGSVVFSSSTTSRRKYVVFARTGRVRLCDPSNTPGCEP